MMQKIIQHVFLESSQGHKQLSLYINRAIERGWQPYGEPIRSTSRGVSVLIQAVVKYAPVEAPNHWQRTVIQKSLKLDEGQLIHIDHIFAELTMGTRKALKNKGVAATIDLICMTAMDLLKIPKLGPKRVNEIKEVLAGFNMTLHGGKGEV
jgi:Bacterial RNA polymerase, alpha chain C terminal domain/Domain of unknown function (DUF1737)